MGVKVFGDMHERCSWANPADPLYCAYHDDEWGVPEWDSRALWEKLVLDGFQAGLVHTAYRRRAIAFHEVGRGGALHPRTAISATSPWRGQPTTWSLTMPTACMKA